MVEGIYRIAFTGVAGSGFGILLFKDGMLAGADVGGATYDGAYTEDAAARSLDAKIMMRAPAGITPVQTGVPIAEPMSLPINGRLPLDLGGGNPLRIETPLGPVNVIFSKIRDLDI